MEAALTAHLTAMGIAQEAAAGFAKSLIADGFDTPEAFAQLSLDELAQDFGFKRGHLRMVSTARETPLGDTPSFAAVGASQSHSAQLGASHENITTRSASAPPLQLAAPAVPAVVASLPQSTEDTAMERTVSHGSNAAPVLQPQADIGDCQRPFVIFGSMRFPAPAEALELVPLLAAEGVVLQVVDVSAGEDISSAVFEGIRAADAFMIFGTKDYGEDTGNPACTYHELKYAQHKRKTIIPLRMIPFDEDFEHTAADVFFGGNRLSLFWLSGSERPPNIVSDILACLQAPELESQVELVRSSTSPAALGARRREIATVQIATCEAFAQACGATLQELVANFSLDDVKELMGEKEESGLKIGILGRKRILADFSRLLNREASSTESLTDNAGSMEPSAEEDEWEPWIMIIGNAEQAIILSFLPIEDIGSMARVSRHWRTRVSDDFMWERRCQIEFGVDSLIPGIPTFRGRYRSLLEFVRLPGTCIEVLDTYNIWSVARVLLVLDDQHRFLIWFEGWGDEWLMWLDSRYDLPRIRPCQSEIAGIGKRGPLSRDSMIAKQRQCIDAITAGQSLGPMDNFPRSCVWRVPQASPSQGVYPAPYCPGFDGTLSENFSAEFVDMEDPSRVVRGGRKNEAIEPFRATLSNDCNSAKWARSQQAVMERRPFQSCEAYCARAREGETKMPTCIDYKKLSTSEAVAKPWYRLVDSRDLHETWEPHSAVVGVLPARSEVEILELAAGSAHFPPPAFDIDLRAMARTDRGWFEARNKNGASNVRAIPAPQPT